MMNRLRSLIFTRVNLVLAIGLLSFCTSSYLLSSRFGGEQSSRDSNAVLGSHNESSPARDPELGVLVANTAYSPEDVVRRQMQWLNEATTNPEQVSLCYGLASPSNRLVTGPVQRFSEMVLMPPFNQIVGATDYQVGVAEVQERFANVLVTGVSQDESAFAFRFLLEKQVEEPFVDCWMTNAVLPLSFVAFDGTPATFGLDNRPGQGL